MKHKGCVTDPITRQWWRDYREVAGAIGISFVEYVARRALAEATTVISPLAPVYPASCGHMHAWGGSCSSLTI